MELGCLMCRPLGLPNRYRNPVAHATGRDVSPSGLDVSPSGLAVSRSGLAVSRSGLIDRKHRPCGFWGGLLSFAVVFMQLWRLSFSSNGLDFHFGDAPSSGVYPRRPVSLGLLNSVAYNTGIPSIGPAAERLLSDDFG